MDQMIGFDAILFPSDGRAPHLVKLMTSPTSGPDPHAPGALYVRMPHPEIHMDYIAEIGSRAWKYQVCPLQINFFSKYSLQTQLVEALDGMNRNFTNPYVIFYPTLSRDGMPFPVNKAIREIQGGNYSEPSAWRGNIVVAKYRDSPFSS
jgi:hypothetical protein